MSTYAMNYLNSVQFLQFHALDFFLVEEGPHFNYRIKTLLPSIFLYNTFADKADFVLWTAIFFLSFLLSCSVCEMQ